MNLTQASNSEKKRVRGSTSFISYMITALNLVIIMLSSSICFAISPLYLVQESYPDILLKYEGGVLTTVGNIGFLDVRGLAYDVTTDTLYGVSRDSDQLITINRTTGTGTAVSSNNYLPAGSNTAEISVSSAGNMFGTGHLNDQSAVDTLLSVNETTGIASTVGPLGVVANMSGLAFDHASGKLYGTTYSGNLYTIDPVTGTATLVGPITGENNVARIAFDQIDGTLYGVTVSNQLVSIDIATLVATQVAQFPALEQIYSMDFISLSQRQTQSVPTINNWGMIIFMVIAGLGAVFYLRRSKRA